VISLVSQSPWNIARAKEHCPRKSAYGVAASFNQRERQSSQDSFLQTVMYCKIVGKFKTLEWIEHLPQKQGVGYKETRYLRAFREATASNVDDSVAKASTRFNKLAF